MSLSTTITESRAFTITDAIHMAAKVATDLKRMQRLYPVGTPSDLGIQQYEAEVVALLRAGYLGEVTYGFRRDGKWVEPTLRYTAVDLAGVAASDDDPGKLHPGADITGATFYSYLMYSPAWHRLPAPEQKEFESGLPFQRGGAPEPGISGYLMRDKVYSSGGRALNRASVRAC